MIKEKQNGYILISVLVIMLVLMTIMFYLADALFSETAIARNQKAATAAFHLAEAGTQEAIYKIKNDPATRARFIGGAGTTSFEHNSNALITNGSYSVDIDHSAPGAAIITSTGFYNIGLKTAQRMIKINVTQATTDPPYTYDGAIFTGGSTGEEDITFTNTNLTITGTELWDDDNDPLTPEVPRPIGSLISNRDIWYTDSVLNISKDILAIRDIRPVRSTVTVGGIIDDYNGGTYLMPTVDITSACPSVSYKCLAMTAPNHYYTVSEFEDLINANPNTTLNGVVYIAGNSGVNIINSHNVTINGMLVSEASIDIGSPSKEGTLTINHNGPSGIIALSKVNVGAKGALTVHGLVYVGDRFSYDPVSNSFPAGNTITFEGGILARRFLGNGTRTVNINFNRDFINEALRAGTSTPVIQFQHWEEEY